MLDFIPEIIEGKAARKITKATLREDLGDLVHGKLDIKSFFQGYVPARHPVEVVVFNRPLATKILRKKGFTVPDMPEVWPVELNKHIPKQAIKAIRRQHNLRVTMGRDQWQRLLMFGNISANATFATAIGAATATSSSSLTNSGALYPTTGGPNTGLEGQIVVCMSSASAVAYGVIMSNTGTVLTVDKWHSFTSATDATASTPSSTTYYAVLPTAMFALWVGLSTNSTAAAAGDVLRTADGLFADGTTSATATEQTGSGLARAFIQPTFPSPGEIQLAYTWTYTGSSSVTIAKCVCCNSTAAAGSLLFLETLMSATATVTSSGDSIAITWTINL